MISRKNSGPDPATLHFICGATGAGKTTYAAKLAQEIGAIYFGVDDWMAALYWQDAPQPLKSDWAMERVARCQKQIWHTAKQVAARGMPCILEIGFGQAATRAQYGALAKEAGLSVTLHFLDVPADERWRRVEQRNAEKSGPLGFDVTRAMFDFTETLWEPPSPAEMSTWDGVCIG
jgi:predicted kinase